MDKRAKVYWHESFYEGLKLDLNAYRDSLDYKIEHPLSQEALIIDIVVVKNENNIKIDNSIGRIFRRHNLFEFKSEKDSLSIHDYDKVMGYARIYSAFGKVPHSDITVSFALTMYPREIEKVLEKERGLKVRDMGDGVYYVEGDTYPVQILERKKLTDENLFTKNLHTDISTEDMVLTLEAMIKIKPLDLRNAYTNGLIQANPITFREAMKVSDVVKELFFEVANEEGWLREQENEKISDELKKVAKNLLSLDVSVEKVSNATGLPIDIVESLA